MSLPGGTAPTRLRVQADRAEIAGASAALLAAALVDLGHRARLVDARQVEPGTAGHSGSARSGDPRAGAPARGHATDEPPSVVVEAAAGDGGAGLPTA